MRHPRLPSRRIAELLSGLPVVARTAVDVRQTRP
jgi:hypothetical protein